MGTPYQSCLFWNPSVLRSLEIVVFVSSRCCFQLPRNVVVPRVPQDPRTQYRPLPRIPPCGLANDLPTVRKLSRTKFLAMWIEPHVLFRRKPSFGLSANRYHQRTVQFALRDNLSHAPTARIKSVLQPTITSVSDFTMFNLHHMAYFPADSRFVRNGNWL